VESELMRSSVAFPSTPPGREEILRRLRYRIVGGVHRNALRTGDRLPSLRELATEWSVDPRVIRAAYGALQREGVVELRPRSGVYVAIAPAGPTGILPQMGDWITAVFLQARSWGMPPVACHDRLRRCIETVRLRVACVESNEDQISWFVHESQSDYGVDAFGLDLDTIDAGEVTRRIRGADLIITTAFHAELVESVARAERTPVVLLRLAGDFVERITGALRDGPLYFVVADRRFAEKLPIIYGGVEGGNNLRPFVAGEDDLRSIPADAAVYVTRAAELRLANIAAHRTVTSPGRIFSDSMAAELLGIIVRSNIAAMQQTPATIA
jgi:hypothetical protein